MTTAKIVILTSIKFKGIEQVKTETKELSANLLCSEQYVKNIINKVKTGKIRIL
jgi:hypothetical protein